MPGTLLSARNLIGGVVLVLIGALAGRALDTDGPGLAVAAALAFFWMVLFVVVRRGEAKGSAQEDPVTGLMGRYEFQDHVASAIDAARRGRRLVAVGVLDLDRFKQINDTLGHESGDALLRQVADRLRATVGEIDVVARMGADEFGILIANEPDWPGIKRAMRELGAALESPFNVAGLDLEVGSHMGVAVAPDHGDDAATVIHHADSAMHDAKSAHNNLVFYSPDDEGSTPGRLMLAGELRKAIRDREVILYYQPKADLSSGRVGAVEALVRWQHPRDGLVPPDEFIPLAESTGLIRSLTFHVLDASLRQCREWRDEGLQLGVAVNLSARDLLDASFPSEVEGLLAKWDLPPGSLELEITESAIMDDPQQAMEVLKALSAMGVSLAIDDFGTGYSSLAYLKQLPVDKIKIDKSFVMSMAVSESDAVIVRSTIDLGRNLGLQVIAEGVETENVWNRLVALGCDHAQGYYLSWPIPGEEIAKWIRKFESDLEIKSARSGPAA